MVTRKKMSPVAQRILIFFARIDPPYIYFIFSKPGSPLYLALPLSWHCHRLLHLQHGERGTNPAKIWKGGWLLGICLVIFVRYIYNSLHTSQTLLGWEIGFEAKSPKSGTACQNTCWIICWYIVPK